MDNFPGGVRVNYTAGFEKDKVPSAIVDLIENMSAYKILTFIGPLLFPQTSVGISMDGVSQSVGTPGPQFLAQRIKDLEGIIEKQKMTIRGYYSRPFQIDFF
jgi:hypothetical protein